MVHLIRKVQLLFVTLQVIIQYRASLILFIIIVRANNDQAVKPRCSRLDVF
jgi:hypothetical protein